MAKKIILGVLFLGLVGALVAGAVNRTAAKSSDTNSAAHRGAGWARMQDGAELASNLEGRGGQGGGRNQALASGQAGQLNLHEPLNLQQGAGRNQGARGQAGNAQRSRQPIAETKNHQWVALNGTVTSIDDMQMTVQTEAGEIVIADRPWSYAVQAGFSAQVGDQVTLEGFYENETFEVGRLTNGEQIVSIREDSGRPLWAGGGRWSGRGRSG